MTVAPANTSMVGGTSTARSSFHCPGLSRLEGESPMGLREKKNKARGHLTRRGLREAFSWPAGGRGSGPSFILG